MKGCSYRFDVDRFVGLRRGSEYRVELDGWIVSDAAIEHVRLVAREASLPVAFDPQADDADRRLLLSVRAPLSDDPGCGTATIEVNFTNGDRLAFEVGHLFRPPDWMPAILSLDLLAVPDAGALAHALVDGFASLDQAGDLLLHRCGAAWVATICHYGLSVRTAIGHEVDREVARDLARPYVRQRLSDLLRELESGIPLLVHRATTADTDETMMALFAAVRDRNPDAALLWVETARPAGPVQRYRAGSLEAAEPAILLASARDPWDAILSGARDSLVAPR